MNHNRVVKNEDENIYHANREYIGSSSLVDMAKSPLHFYHAWKSGENDVTEPMERGSFMHKILLEQDIEKYIARPMNAEGELVRSNSAAYKDFIQQNPGKTPVHPDLYNDAMNILTAACKNQKFLLALQGSDVECSFYAKHPTNGLLLKARTDIIARDGSFVMDVKTTSDIQKFQKQIFYMGYDVRMVHYVETIAATTGQEIPDIYFFAIESKAPYASKTFRLSKKAIKEARELWTAWTNEISSCISDNSWPGYSTSVVEVDRPKYLSVDTEVSFEEVG